MKIYAIATKYSIGGGHGESSYEVQAIPVHQSLGWGATGDPIPMFIFKEDAEQYMTDNDMSSHWYEIVPVNVQGIKTIKQ